MTDEASDMLAAALGSMPCWHLRHADGSLYLARYVLWGADALNNHDSGATSSAFVHHIHTADGDAHMHNHPWLWAAAVVLQGGYEERRSVGGSGRVWRRCHYRQGDLNVLRPGDYHSIVAVEPDTWTLFVCGREAHNWGFLVDSQHVPHGDYFKRADAQHMTHELVSG